MGVDPVDVNKKKILYSSFTLQPIPAHLLAPGADSYAEQTVISVSADELEDQLKRLPPRDPFPPKILANPIFNCLVQNVRNQNPGQKASPTTPQLLQELRRQKALRTFLRRHVELLTELTQHLGNGESALDTFASDPELDVLMKEITESMSSRNPQVTSDQIHEEISLRIREGQSHDKTDHNIHHLQYLSSQVLQQVKRDMAGNRAVPRQLEDDALYQQIQGILKGWGTMSGHDAMRDYIDRRIKELRDQRHRDLNPGLVDQPGGTFESIAPSATTSIGAPRTDVPKYNMDPNSAAGLPTGFAFDPKWSENLTSENNVRLNLLTIPYYVNDGPQGLYEGGTHYRRRIRRAVENMGIEHRVMPVLRDEELRQFNGDKVAIAEARLRLKSQISRDETAHRSKLRKDGRFNTYDEDYANMWKAEKRARQARNAVRRRNAQEKLRADFMTWNEILGQRLPTPPPPDDSGDELYDFTIVHGPRILKYQRDGVGRPLRSKDDRSGGTSTHSTSRTRKKPKLPLKCAGCEASGASCSIPEVGAPCVRCKRMGIKCLQQHQQDGSTFISTQTAQVSTSITPETPANDGDKIYSDFKSGYHTDLEGGRWPILETASDLSFDDWIPCDTCLVNERACDNDGPPCGSCILHGVRSSCSSAIAEDQSYQAQPLVMEYDPAQLRLVPDTEVSTNAWDRINSMLEAGAPSVPSNYISPYPPIPQPAPMAPVNWDEIDEQLGFSSNMALGNASAEMEAQSSNWASKEDRV